MSGIWIVTLPAAGELVTDQLPIGAAVAIVLAWR
jgi:hypothetical protein